MYERKGRKHLKRTEKMQRKGAFKRTRCRIKNRGKVIGKSRKYKDKSCRRGAGGEEAEKRRQKGH